MLFRLIFKDLSGYKRYIVFAIFVPGIVWTMLIFSRFYPWHAYLMFCILAVCAAGSYYTFSEKKQNLHNLFCSLPVTRRQIVLGKYVTTLVIGIIGIILFAMIIKVNQFLSARAARDFDMLMHPKIAFMSFYLYAVFISIFLPSVFRLGLFGMAVALTLALVNSIHSYVLLFRPYRMDFVPYFTAHDGVKTLIAVLAMCLLPAISCVISMKLFEEKDL